MDMIKGQSRKITKQVKEKIMPGRTTPSRGDMTAEINLTNYGQDESEGVIKSQDMSEVVKRSRLIDRTNKADEEKSPEIPEKSVI